jgi:hypothetical protein
MGPTASPSALEGCPSTSDLPLSDSLGVAVQYIATGHKLKSSFNQMETPTHFSLNCTHGAIRKPPFCLSV